MYVYRHFIPQNTAPAGAKRIGVYDAGGSMVCTVPLGRLTPPKSEKLYSFGIVSDIHLYPMAAVAWTPETKFDHALTFFEKQGCVMCIACGDLTNTGFYRRTNESDASTTYLDEQQFAKYKELCEKHTIPVYGICGNHESYYGMPIAVNLDKLETYTGRRRLSYAVEYGSDLFLLCGQDAGSSVMSDADFQWLGEMLKTNQNRRCFVFVHSYIEEDSGDAVDYRENSIFDYWGTTKTNSFMNLLRQHPNIVLFHGHSHMKFECQEYDSSANYTERNGFKSVHIPSAGRPRDLDLETGSTPEDDEGSQGCIVDVYEECIVINGVDLLTEKSIPLGTFKIDIEPG